MNMIKGFVIGGAIAAGLALLLTPKSGAEIRQDIKTNLVEAGHKTSLMLDDASQRAKQAMLDAQDEVRRRMARAASDAQATATDLKHGVREVIEENI